MKYSFVRSTAFVRAAKRVVKKRPQFAQELKLTLELLSEDLFHPALKTHKLKGDLEGCWACSVSYDLRIIFEIEQPESNQIVLLTVGTHDEVY